MGTYHVGLRSLKEICIDGSIWTNKKPRTKRDWGTWMRTIRQERRTRVEQLIMWSIWSMTSRKREAIWNSWTKTPRSELWWDLRILMWDLTAGTTCSLDPTDLKLTFLPMQSTTHTILKQPLDIMLCMDHNLQLLKDQHLSLLPTIVEQIINSLLSLSSIQWCFNSRQLHLLKGISMIAWRGLQHLNSHRCHSKCNSPLLHSNKSPNLSRINNGSLLNRQLRKIIIRTSQWVEALVMPCNRSTADRLNIS